MVSQFSVYIKCLFKVRNVAPPFCFAKFFVLNRPFAIGVPFVYAGVDGAMGATGATGETGPLGATGATG